MLPYKLEYQDHGFESWEHKILSYETLMAIQDRDLNINVDTDDILSLLAGLQVEKLWEYISMWGVPNASENLHSDRA